MKKSNLIFVFCIWYIFSSNFAFTQEYQINKENTTEKGVKEIIKQAMEAAMEVVPKVAQDFTHPGFHYRPPAQWMNDVCGGFYHQGWYHIFYQFNPFSDMWSSDNGMGWGHARSRDMVHWEHFPPALMPAEVSDNRMDASGSAFFNKNGKPVLFFSKTPRSGPREQWAALPVDNRLISWRRIDIGLVPGKSGIPEDISPSWADMFVFEADNRVFAIFKDSNGLLVEAQNESLMEWKAIGSIDGIKGECPNLFSLDKRFILIRSTFPISYIVGNFKTQNLTFLSNNPERTMDYGYGTETNSRQRGLYGTTVFKDANGRSILMGWISGFKEGRGWNGCASLPRVLALTDDDQLIQNPLPELTSLRGLKSEWKGALNNTTKVIPGINSDMLEIEVRFRPDAISGTTGLRLRSKSSEKDGIVIRFSNGILDVDGTLVPEALSADGTLNMHIFFDRSVLEVFIDHGLKTVTKVVYPLRSKDLHVETFTEGCNSDVISINVWELKSIWNDHNDNYSVWMD